MNIYFKGYWNKQPRSESKLHKMIADTDNHLEAIMLTQSWIEEEKHNILSPILCVINGDKEGSKVTNEAA